MEKSSMEMDIEEWELLPIPNESRTFFELGFESGKDLLFSKDAVVDNHITHKTQEVTKNSTSAKDRKEDYSLIKFKDIGVVQSPKVLIDQHDFVSQAIFKKYEFVDVNVESPKYSTRRKIMPFITPNKEEEEFSKERKYSSTVKEDCVNHDAEEKPSCEGLGLKGWRWKLVGGVGALCSVGVAAATIFILVLGHQQPEHESNSQRLQFQIYADEKRIKQVTQQATRWNHALATARGVPMARANISFGGYYDGL